MFADLKISTPVRLKPADPGRILTLSEARLFVSQSGVVRRVSTHELRASCIDGRYPAGQSGAIAMPGGDAGLLAIGLAASKQLRKRGTAISNEVIRDAVFAVVGGPERFHYHGDDERGRDGCWHCNLMRRFPKNYYLDHDTANFMELTLRQLESRGLPPTILQGANRERAVFMTRLVQNLATDEPWQPTTAIQAHWMLEHQSTIPGRNGPVHAFVYNADLTAMRLWQLADAIVERTRNGTSIDRASLFRFMTQVEQGQLELTRGNRAGLLPAYEVAIEDSTGRTQVSRLAL